MRASVSLLVLFACRIWAAERLTLRDAVSQALSNNPALLATKADIAVADARLLTARLLPNPVATLTGDHLDILGSHFNDVNGGGPSEIALGMEFTLERGGKRPRRVEVAQEARGVAELQFRNAARGVVLQVENAFVEALLARDSLDVSRQNLGFLRQIVEINQARVKAGDIPEVEFVRSRLAELQYETAVRQGERRVREALVQVQTLIGRGRPAPDFEIEGDLDREDSVALLDDMQKEALETRPDLLALRRDLQRAGAELALQRASAKQDWTVGTDYRRQQVNARANAMTLSLSVPLAFFNRNQGEIARAEQEKRQAELRVRALQSEIAGEVESAWLGFSSARGLLETIRGSMLQSAREVREITDFAYRRGEASLLTLLDAQRAFNETMQAYVEARAEYARSLYELDNVCGKDASFR